MPGSPREDTRTGRRFIGLVGLALACITLGFVLAQQRAEQRIARTEQANRDLRAGLETLQEGMRNARAPLERRLREVEGALGGALGGIVPPPTPDPDPALLARIETLESELARSERDVQAARTELGEQLARSAGTNARDESELLAARAAVASERETLSGELSSLTEGRQALLKERDVLRGERDVLRSERDALREERDAIRGERDTLSNKLAQQRESGSRELTAQRAELDRKAGEQRAELDRKLAEQRKRNEALTAEVARLEQRARAATAAPRVVAARPAPTRAPVVAAPVATRTAIPPAVSAPPPAAAQASGCESLEEPGFVLVGSDTSVQRLGDRLTLRVHPGNTGPLLQVGGSRDRYPLESAPQHISFDCAGTSYIVSVCEIDSDPLQVTGEIRLGEGWRAPCR